MDFNHCSNQPRTPEQFARALRRATDDQRLIYAEMHFKQRFRTRRQFYAGHAIGSALDAVLNNASPPAWLEPHTKPKSHGCPHSG